MRAGGARWALGLVAALAVGLTGCGGTPGHGTGASPPAGTGTPSSAAASSPHTGGSSTVVWFGSLQMVSATAGWALRWTRDPGRLDAARLAPARTTDGGRTWADVTPQAARSLLTPTRTAGTLFALNATTAWFAVSRQRAGHPPRTVVFATSDGGRTWRASTAFGSLGSPGLLHFTDAEHGWLMADLGAAMGSDAVAIFTTADGGAHWSLAARTRPLAGPGTGTGGLPLRCDKAGIRFATTMTGWVTGDCAAGAPLVEVTHDGGHTWARQALPGGGQGCSGGSQAASPQFFGTTGYLLVSCFPHPSLLVTHDAGATWSRAALPAGPGAFPRVRFVNARHGFLVPAGPQGSRGHVLYRTPDGGHSWQAVHPGLPAAAPGASLEFVTATAGFAWVPGAQSTSGVPPLCRTRDGGRTWACAVPRMTAAQHPG